MPRHALSRPDNGRTLHVTLTVLTAGVWAVTGWPIAALRRRRRERLATAATVERLAYL
jgi:hypothetical protein